jgi:hypothetical protein
VNAPALPFPARTTDPDTSQSAAALPRVTLREQVRCALTVHPSGLTDWEITAYLGLPDRRKASVGKRRQELGAIDTGLRRRSIDGQPCIVWRLS